MISFNRRGLSSGGVRGEQLKIKNCGQIYNFKLVHKFWGVAG